MARRIHPIFEEGSPTLTKRGRRWAARMGWKYVGAKCMRGDRLQKPHERCVRSPDGTILMAVSMETDFESWGRLAAGEASRLGFGLGIFPKLRDDGGRDIRIEAKCQRCGERFDDTLTPKNADRHAIVEAFRDYLYKLREHRSGHDAADGSITRDQLRYEIERAFRAVGQPEAQIQAFVRAFEKMTNPQAVTEAYGLLANPPSYFSMPSNREVRHGEWLRARDAWIASYAPNKATARPAGLTSGAQLDELADSEPTIPPIPPIPTIPPIPPLSLSWDRDRDGE